MKRVFPGLALVSLFLTCLIWLAPATWLDYALQRGSHGAIGLGAAQGRVWHGQGSLQAVLPNGDVVTLDRIDWRLHGADLLRGQLRLVADSTQGGQRVLDARLGRNGLTLHVLRLEIPSALLGVFSPTLRDAELRGRLMLKVEDWRLNQDRPAGLAELVWRDAGSGLSQVRPLGQYRLLLRGDGNAIEGRLETLGEAALTLAGSGRWQTGHRLTLDAVAIPAASRQQELAPLLRILGREVAPGRYQLELTQGIGALGRQ